MGSFVSYYETYDEKTGFLEQESNINQLQSRKNQNITRMQPIRNWRCIVQLEVHKHYYLQEVYTIHTHTSANLGSNQMNFLFLYN